MRNLREQLQRNLMHNGDFERGLEGWSTEHYWYALGKGLSQWEVDEKTVKSGKHSLKVIGKNNRGIAIQDLRPPFPTCRVSGWLRCENLKGYARIFIEFIDASGKWLAGVVVGEVTGTTDWTFVSKEVTMPTDAVVFRVDLLTTEPNDGVAWFDDISVVPVLPPSDGKPPEPPKFQVKPVEGEDCALQITWDLPSEDVIAVQIFAEPKPFNSVDNLLPRAVLQRHIRSFILRGLNQADSIYIALIAVDVDGMRSKPNVQRCQVKDLRPPEPVWWEWEPVKPAIKEGRGGYVRLRWRISPADSDISKFVLKRFEMELGAVPFLEIPSNIFSTEVWIPYHVPILLEAIDSSGNKSESTGHFVVPFDGKTIPVCFAEGRSVQIESPFSDVTLAPENWLPTKLPSNLGELIRQDDKGEGEKLAKKGVVFSPLLRCPKGARWDMLSRSATVPEGTSLRIAVLNKEGKVLEETAGTWIDMRNINSPVVRLRATLEGNGKTTPKLHAWWITLYASRKQVQFCDIVVAETDGFQLWFNSPLFQIFRDTPPEPTNKWEIHVARNEWEAVQLAVRSKRDLLWMRLRVAPEVERLFDVQIRYVGYIHLPANSRATPVEELVRKAPDDFPDPLLDLPFVPLRANETQPVFIKLKPKKATKAGVYDISLTVQTPLGERTATLRVRVYPFVFPDRTRLWFTNWFRADNFARYHGVPEWGNEHFRWMRLYARLMREHRQNVLLVPLGLVRVWRRQDGNFRFDFERFDRFIETFEAEGVAERLELSHIGGRKTGRWEDPEFVAHPIWATDELTGEGVEVPLETFLQAVRDHLKATKRLHKAMLHIADEPIPVNVESWKALSERVHRAVPELPRIDAIHVANLKGYLEIFVPQLNFFAQWLNFYRQRQREGSEVWFYTAWLPQGKWTNRLIDYPLIKTRLLHWFNVRYGATGFLHWGWNFWGDVMVGELQSPGDAFIVYPGPNASLRMEAQRDGIEDAELLWSLAEKMMGKKPLTPEQTTKLLEPLLEPVIRNFTEYTKNPAELETVRRQVLAKL